jgi:hypothetical protein
MMIIKSFAVKRIVVIAFALVLLLSPVACSRVDLSDKLKTDPMGYTPKQIKEEIMPQVAETVVEALEKDDEDKLKSVFSKKALEDTTDWNLGCEYIFDLYEGTHTDIRDYNYSQYETYKMDESINEISCICYIETGDKVYRLDWVDVLENEADADSVGVYNLCIREWEEGYGKEGGVFPGIDYPERFSGSYITTAIETVGDYANSSLDMPLLYVSDKLLGNMSEDEKTDLAKALLAINNKNIKKRWCEPSNEGEQASFFIDADISSVGKCVLSFICDTEVRNEITAVKVTMYDGDIPASSELVAEEYKAEGINEFVQKCIAGGVDFSQYPETMEEAFADDNKTIPEIEYEGKTLNLIPNVIAAQRAEEAGCQETILHRGGQLTECAHSALVIIKDRKVIGPVLDNLILPSITRKHVWEICEDLGIETESRNVSMDEVFDADEILVLSTSKLMTRADEIDGKPAGMKDSETAEKIRNEYFRRVQEETGYWMG